MINGSNLDAVDVHVKGGVFDNLEFLMSDDESLGNQMIKAKMKRDQIRDL